MALLLLIQPKACHPCHGASVRLRQHPQHREGPNLIRLQQGFWALDQQEVLRTMNWLQLGRQQVASQEIIAKLNDIILEDYPAPDILFQLL